ncbi:Crp/Fnr family transcriptional regulator [Varunaivibrio sulfuroxidans]|uniref:CRP-like cAMP-binding protein n=1 Tax=Varunaivibrio sulfuroxidans TaxID=1773489 RepID=A0A4R3J9F8_9PROT|nr:Crp/Fnr family transcriptional regulator [Varunaivibrio sulfuroxidans]TCS62508.1 CRP-like cAMP-binding protein [Varunaivibrio sulfuroxidans]WES30821.1 Crp/Fnr family transcriptional regulator [Varunaivibrio sulfuroxidans]
MSEAGTGNLAKIQLLASLNADEMESVNKACRWKLYAAGEQIIDQHSESQDVFFVVEGRVRIVNYSLSGREVTFDDLDAGSHFGELAAIDGLPRSASVLALENSLIAALGPEHFGAVLSRHPSIAVKVMRHLAHLVRTATARIMDLSTLGANNRVHADVLRLALLVADDNNTARISPIPVHSDIASRVSTTRETVARVMNDLARKGIVERGKNFLIVKDVARLQDMVDEVRGD